MSARCAGSGRAAAVLLGVVLVVALTGVACATAPDDGSVADVMVAGDYRSQASSTFPLVDDAVVRLTVTDTEVSLSAGCNTLAAPYSLDGDVLVVDEVASTLIGCPADLADQDARLAALLTSRPVVSSAADAMTWTGSGGVTLAFIDRAVAEPDLALSGTRWRLDGVADGDVAVSAVGFDEVTLVFDGSTVTVATGCADGRAAYRSVTGEGSADGDVVLDPLQLDRSGDPCAEGVGQAESALVAVFGGSAGVRVVGDVLELRRGEVVLTFRGS